MSFVSWFLIIYFVKDLIIYNFPKEYAIVKQICLDYLNELFVLIEPYTISTMIKLLYCYSVVEIKFLKLKKALNPYILNVKHMINNYIMSRNNDTPICWDLKTKIEIFDFKEDFVCIKLGCYSSSLNEQDNTLDDYVISNNVYHYYVITSFLENDQTNKIVFNSNKNDKIINKCCNSNVHFISLSVNVDGLSEPIDIHLKTDEYNYYMVSNKIDKHFIYYYLNYHKKIACSTFDNFKYTLDVMDNNVNMFTITEKDGIYIDEELYTLNLFKEELTSEMNVQENDNIIESIIDDVINNVIETNNSETIDNNDTTNKNESNNRCKTDSFGEQDYIKL
jgi:hypothetical protein